MAYAHAHPHMPAPQRRRWTPWMWGITLVSLLFWSVLCWVTAWVIGAVLGWLPDGSVSAGMETVTQWPVPAWLAPWVDPAWLGLVMQSVRDAVQWLAPWLPSADTLAGLVSALAWGVWALGALGMLLVAAGVHWWARRR